MSFPENDRDTDVLTESETRIKKPPLYKVLLHNDNYTTMEFVVYVLRNVFRKSDSEAFTIMLKVHQAGVGIAGVYTHEIAQMKAEKTVALARENDYPLLATIEEE